MKNRIVLILSALILFSVPFQSTYHQVEAAVSSKAATLTAKKIVKEVIQEAAVNQAANLAVMEAMEIADKYQAKAGYKIVCPGGGSTCDKPVQVKETLTSADKTAIKSQAEIELDKLITPDGKGFSRWQKFLDWFLPIWAVTFAITALTYAIDGEFRALLNEAGYNALVALGIITPLTGSPEMVDETDVPETTTDNKYTDSGGIVKAADVYSNDYYNIGTASMQRLKNVYNKPFQNVVVDVQYRLSEGSSVPAFGFDASSGSAAEMFGYSQGIVTVGTNQVQGTTGVTAVINIDGVTVFNGTPYYSSGEYSVQQSVAPEINTFIGKRIKSIQHRSPYEMNGFYYTDTLYKTVSGNIMEVQVKSPNNIVPKPNQHSMNITIQNATGTTYVDAKVYYGITPYKKLLVPTYEETGTDPMADSSYISEDGERIALVPPTAITYQDETTGETVERKPNATGDGLVFEKPDGTIVPEENVVPNDPPEVVKDPQGVPTVTPSPSPSNPAPEPVPLTPGQTVTEPTPDGNPPPGSSPPGTEEPPLEPFPEGESCQEKLKFPIFSPLKEQLQTSFPFSIPWDIERAAQAAFGGISDEKPEFKVSIPVISDKQEITITTPKFMDEWKSFTDSLLLITFDILLMFGLYRFVKGAGS